MLTDKVFYLFFIGKQVRPHEPVEKLDISKSAGLIDIKQQFNIFQQNLQLRYTRSYRSRYH